MNTFALRMNKLDNYKVDLNGVSYEGVSLQWTLDDSFFSAVQGLEVQQGSVSAVLRVKRSTQVTFEVEYDINGVVSVQCDRCLECMEQPVQAQGAVRVRLGDEDEDDGEVITVNERRGILDLSWFLYEATALAIPMRHVHPGCEQENENIEQE